MDIGDMHEVWAAQAQAEAGYYKDEVEELKKELEKLKAKLKSARKLIKLLRGK